MAEEARETKRVQLLSRRLVDLLKRALAERRQAILFLNRRGFATSLFCGRCGTYVWSRYHPAPGDALFVRAGTLDDPQAVKPDVHIFTRSKLPWLALPKDTRAFESFYKIDEVWSEDSKQRVRWSRRR